MSDTHTHKRDREAPELGQAAARMMRALCRRAQAGDTEALEQLVMLEQLAPQCTQLAGHELVTGGTYTYADVAGELNITRQAAFKRFSRTPNLLIASWVTGVGSSLDAHLRAVRVQRTISKVLSE